MPTAPRGGRVPASGDKEPLLSQRSALIFLLAAVVASIIGGLAFQATGGLDTAGLAAIGGFSAGTYFGARFIE